MERENTPIEKQKNKWRNPFGLCCGAKGAEASSKNKNKANTNARRGAEASSTSTTRASTSASTSKAAQGEDPMMWSRALDRHAFGDASLAVAQGNVILEDQLRFEVGKEATFVGVFDGHGGHDCAYFVCDLLLPILTRLIDDNMGISDYVFRNAFLTTDNEFLNNVVQAEFGQRRVIAAAGTCCLVGFIFGGTLYVANAGDSRAVIGSVDGLDNIVAEQINREHNVNIEEVRQEYRNAYLNEEDIVFKKNGAWRIKGIIQVTRAIGDAYLKRPEYALDNRHPRFRLPGPLTQPLLTAEPTVYTRVLRPEDKFVIFASDGLWNLMDNQQVVQIVHTSPREGIADRLLKMCMNEAIKGTEITYDDLKKKPIDQRRPYHDDITIAVIFIDRLQVPPTQYLLGNDGIVPEPEAQSPPVPEISIRGFNDTVTPSMLKRFNFQN